jgi:site-specific recombinase XerD
VRRQIRENTVTLQHVQTVRKGSAVYRYLRIPGQPRIRLPDLPPDHPDFLDAYVEATRAAPKKIRATTGSVRALVEAFLRSEVYLSYSAGYRAIIRRHADAIADQAEDARVAHLRSAHIQADLAPLLPNVAAQRLKAWRAICAFGKEKTLLTIDPTKDVVKKKIPETDGHIAWTLAEVAKFREAYPIGTATRAIFEVLHWTGCRISDAVKIGPGMVGADGVLAYRQIKTGDMAYVPWNCPLKPFVAAGQGDRDMMHAAIEAVSAGRRQMTFLATAQGRTRSHKAAGHVISNAAARLDIDKSAHGLRKLRAATLAEGGASILEIGAWTGHQTLAEIAHYTESADRRRAVTGTEQDRNSVNSPDPSCKLVAK